VAVAERGRQDGRVVEVRTRLTAVITSCDDAFCQTTDTGFDVIVPAGLVADALTVSVPVVAPVYVNVATPLISVVPVPVVPALGPDGRRS